MRKFSVKSLLVKTVSAYSRDKVCCGFNKKSTELTPVRRVIHLNNFGQQILENLFHTEFPRIFLICGMKSDIITELAQINLAQSLSFKRNVNFSTIFLEVVTMPNSSQAPKSYKAHCKIGMILIKFLISIQCLSSICRSIIT